jgi:hypothetical protein
MNSRGVVEEPLRKSLRRSKSGNLQWGKGDRILSQEDRPESSNERAHLLWQRGHLHPADHR